jgi:phage shock protein C
MENTNLKPKTLYRSKTNRIVFGICGGLGEYFDIDPVIFRIIFIVLTFSAGSGILIYLILAFLIPKNPSSAPVENKTEPIDVKDRAQGLVAELKDLKGSQDLNRFGTLRILLGLLIVIIGFCLLAQNLGFIPRYYFYLYRLFNFWPVLIVIAGLSLFLSGTRTK